MSDLSPPFDPKCPCCGHVFSLSDLKRMAVGDGCERYIFIEGPDRPIPVSFSDFNPAEMKPLPPRDKAK